MIKKSVGKLRNLINKRDKLFNLVKACTQADELIVLTIKDHSLQASGHVSDDATTVYMLGAAIGLSYAKALENEPTLTPDAYIQQAVTVAYNQILKDEQ